jgi:hypothetical protein
VVATVKAMPDSAAPACGIASITVRRLRKLYGDESTSPRDATRVSAAAHCPFAHSCEAQVSSASRHDFNDDAPRAPYHTGHLAADLLETTVEPATEEASSPGRPTHRHLLSLSSGPMAVEELWAWLEQTADPASSKLTWPSLRELYADVMGSGYENIVRLRRDLPPTPKRLCAVGLVALCEIEWCAGCSTRCTSTPPPTLARAAVALQRTYSAALHFCSAPLLHTVMAAHVTHRVSTVSPPCDARTGSGLTHRVFTV